MDMESIIKDLREIIPPENFFIEPETSLGILKELESKYQIDTEYFLNNKTNVSDEDCQEWLNACENVYIFTKEN